MSKSLPEDFSKKDIDKVISILDHVPAHEKRSILKLLDELDLVNNRLACKTSFLKFVEYMWPAFILGHHHNIIADTFDRVIAGDCKRVIINMPPRHTKSEFASIHLPAYYLGLFPDRKVIQATHTSELAVGFGRKVRGMVKTEDFISLFPGVSLAADDKAAGRWSTNKRGEYFAVGVGGAVAGKGADLFIIDDPIDEQTGLQGEYNPEVYEKIYEWYGLIRQRLQPGGSIVIVMTRWSKRDLTGRAIRDMTEREGSDQWEIIELPAILPSGKPTWPEYWSQEELEKTKASIPLHRWNAQYQQNPTSEESALIKRGDWKRWEEKDPPKCIATMVSWDTAFEKTQRANYSACTRWGIFTRDDDETGKPVNNIILLDAFRGKWHFPELKRIAKKQYIEFEPDMFIIEAKAAGAPLIQELRASGIPVQAFTPTRGNDKIARVNAVTDVFHSGMVWAPHSRWAEEVIEECAEFPAGEYDDYVDTVSMALLRFRKGGFIALQSDDYDDEPIVRRRLEYY